MAPAPDSDILRSVAKYRYQVLERDAEAVKRLTAGWLRVEKKLADLILLTAQEAAEIPAGQLVGDPLAMMRLERYESLKRQLDAEIRKYGDDAAELTDRNQKAAIKLAGQAAAEQVALFGAGFDALPVNAFETILGQVGGQPFRSYFLRTLTDDCLAAMSQALVDGIGLGRGPRQTAELMRDAANLPYVRALNISRTETLRAYRLASIANYRHSQVVEGWMWLSAKQTRTCISCIAKDGTIYPVDVEFVDHPQGRCAAVPVQSKRPLERTETARQWFDKQSPKVQEGMMGKEKHKAWKGKQIALEDLSQAHTDPTFGTHYGVASFEQALANAERRRGRQ